MIDIDADEDEDEMREGVTAASAVFGANDLLNWFRASYTVVSLGGDGVEHHAVEDGEVQCGGHLSCHFLFMTSATGTRNHR